MKNERMRFEYIDIAIIIIAAIMVAIIIAFGLWRPGSRPAATFEVGINSLGHVR